MLGNAGKFGVFLDDAFDGTRSKAAIVARSIDRIKIAAVVKKKWGKGISTSVKVIANPVGGGFGDENRAIFAAFTANDKFATVKIDGIAIKLD